MADENGGAILRIEHGLCDRQVVSKRGQGVLDRGDMVAFCGEERRDIVPTLCGPLPPQTRVAWAFWWC